jgi:outer membrane protein, multidrug efflux system
MRRLPNEKEQRTMMRIHRSVAILLASTVVLGGCTVGPDYMKPEAALPAGWSQPLDAGVKEQPVNLAEWWRVFHDTTLDSLVDRALRANLDMREAAARIWEVRAQQRIATADRYPQLDSSGSATRNRYSQGSQFGGVLGGRELDIFQIQFDATWEPDVFGGIRRSVEAAQADAEAATENHRGVLVTLLGDVARNYMEVRGLQHRIAVTRQNIHTQRLTLELTTVRFKAGLSNGLDVARAEAQMTTTAAGLPALESSLQQALHRLAVLLGQEPCALQGEIGNAVVPPIPPGVPVGLPSDLLRRRPDIRKAERELAAATARIGAATADLFPKFSLTGQGLFQSLDAETLFNWPNRQWTIGPTFSWPIFYAGRIRANIHAQNARQEQALARYEKAVLTALEEVENALVSYTKEQQRYSALSDAVAANRLSFTLATERYLKGLANFLDVLDAERSLYSSEDQLVQSEQAVRVNLVALYKALGGGWDSAAADFQGS